MLLVFMAESIPEDKRFRIAEYLTRCNYGLKIGNFEMDMSDGEVRYRVAVDVEGGALAPKMIQNMIGVGVCTMDRYFPGFMAVCYGGKSPAEAIEDIEQG